MIISEMLEKYPTLLMITEDGKNYYYVDKRFLVDDAKNEIVDLANCSNFDCVEMAQINGSYIEKIYSNFDCIDNKIRIWDKYLIYDKNNHLTETERIILENMDKTCNDFDDCEFDKCPFLNTIFLCDIAGKTRCNFKEIIRTLKKEIKVVKEQTKNE